MVCRKGLETAKVRVCKQDKKILEVCNRGLVFSFFCHV